MVLKGKEVVYRIRSGPSFSRPLTIIHKEETDHEKVTMR